MDGRIEKLRDSYEDLTDEEINKALEHIDYVLYDTVSGEIIQSGTMDLLSYERFEPYGEGLEKAIVPHGEEWMLRGEFIDHDAGQRMFKIVGGELTAKVSHVEAITSMRMPRDGVKKIPIEAEGTGGKVVTGYETVQEPLRIEGVKAGTKTT